MIVGERWKRLVGEFFFGGGILFGGGKVEKYPNLFDEIFFEKKTYEKNVRQVCKYVDTKVRRKVEKSAEN